MNLSGLIKRLRLYARTVRYLKFRQAAYFVRRRLLPEGGPDALGKVAPIRNGVRMDAVITVVSSVSDENEFRFLNTKKSFDLQRMDWTASDMSRLWRYNLHYFDYLHDQSRSRETIATLISGWVINNPPGIKDAWEPYTVSLRVVNWIKLFLQPEYCGHIPGVWLESLYRQVCWLEKNIEYHILANHYLKNAKALFFAGMFFDGKRADRWLKLGLRILGEEAQEQFLADGGHYERSPMYHAIVVEDYLDVLNLISSSAVPITPQTIAFFKSRSAAALDFLHDIGMPDGDIPLFNDAALGIARQPVQLFEYAGRLIGYAAPRRVEGLLVVAKPESGYFVMRDGDDMMVIDCGLIGPDYQPGHAHCDTLSYELAIGGKRTIVDSGVHDYENGELRHYARSTRAHNTLMVDEVEQSEIWSSFRVGRRAKPMHTSLEKISGRKARFSGAHDGYRHLKGGVIHHRQIEYDTEKGWVIQDELQGSGVHGFESYIHLHPDFHAVIMGKSISVIGVAEREVACIQVVGDVNISSEKSYYFPQFGVKIENTVIRLSGSGELPLQMAYHINKNKVC